MEDLGTDGRVTLKWILKKQDVVRLLIKVAQDSDKWSEHRND